jgi:hypothetical protein
MKYIKTYEYTANQGDEIYQEILLEYPGKIFINVPSSIYFKSDVKYQVIFVDEVYRFEIINNNKGTLSIQYDIKADNALWISHSQEAVIRYDRWNQSYSESSFERIKFMDAKEFYYEYEELFLILLNDAIKNLKEGKRVLRIENYEEILKRLTIPETEHIIQADKYNL